MAAKGYSLHLGVNYIDPNHYGGTGKLSSCENDARYMKNIMDLLGYKSKILLSERATRKNVYNNFMNLSDNAVKGDIVIITNSSHGSFIYDFDNDESDGRDETWCLYDAQLIDDEIFYLLSQFKEGVRVVLVTDSCHNKSIYKSLNTWDSQQKSLESEKSFEIFERNKHFYENVLLQLKQYPKKTCKASIITISACQDNDTTNTGNPLSEFTRNLSEVWNNSIFNGTYESFIEEIATKPSHGIPQISFSGLKNQNFKNEKPFVI